MKKNSFFLILPRPFSLTLAGVFAFSISLILCGFHTRNERIPVASVGVHHLGPEYRINEFYVDKKGGSSVGEGGGGGGHVCCITLPRKWQPGLQAEVRWEVHHKSMESNQALAPKIETEGIYKALVPIEAYSNPSDFYIHFFPGGRVRIIVSDYSPIADQHPVRWDDPKAAVTATVGAVIENMFTPEELAELEHNLAQEKSKHGDWR